jgi:glycosyltransferase involved in cell wall biosynthesis
MKSDNGLVSIIMIFLNKEIFIYESIESVLTQTYNNWELILIDDGSTDKSTDIAINYANNYADKIKYISHPFHKNMGMSASRNLGIRYAKGIYIAFLDADDVWLPQNLEHKVELMNLYPEASAIFSKTQSWITWEYGKNEKNIDRIEPLFIFESAKLIKPPKLIWDYLYHSIIYNWECGLYTCSFLVKRSALDRIGGFEDCFRSLREDSAFFSKLLLHETVFLSDYCEARYRKHANSDSAVNQPNEYKFNLIFFKWLSEYLSKEMFNEKQVWDLIEEQLWMCPDQRKKYSKYIPYKLKKSVFDITRLIRKLLRIVRRESFGSISASPNPIVIYQSGRRVTNISWTSKKTKKVEIRLGAPDGILFSISGSSGSSITGNWLKNGMIFYLQDVSDGKPLTKANTLDVIKIEVMIVGHFLI